MDYTQIELRIMALFSGIGAAFSFLVGGVDKLVTALLIFVALDYLKGLKINNTSIKRIFMFIFLYLCSGSPNFYKVTCFYGSQCNI